jgi:hypothetical protein
VLLDLSLDREPVTRAGSIRLSHAWHPSFIGVLTALVLIE